ncbi:MAG: iron complex outermembrane receptor protein [Kiritimatiellia bacterium]
MRSLDFRTVRPRTRTSLVGLSALVFVACLFPQLAHADPKDDARKRFVEGMELAKAGDFEAAIERFRAANDLFRHPATIYNIAYTYQEIGDYESAISWYEQFRDAKPERAADVDGVIAKLRERMSARQAASSPVVGSGSGLSSVELERLRILAAELEDLARVIGERGPGTASPSGPDSPAIGGEPGEPDELGAAGDEGDLSDSPGLFADAYERVVVSASRYGQAPLDSPSTITSLTSDDIHLSGARSIGDLLRRVAGVDVMSMAAGQPEISIRGFNRELNNKVLILIDGRSVYWDFIGTTQWGTFPIVMEEIERIEVIRGPGSAVYGANAVTGVVNIITKTPGERPETVARVDVGTPDILGGAVMTTGRAGSTSWRLSSGYSQHGRWTVPQDLQGHEGVVAFLPDEDRAAQNLSINGRIDRIIGKEGFVSLSGGFVDGFAEVYNIGVLGDFGRKTKNAYARVDATYGPTHFRAFYTRDEGTTGPWIAAPLKAERLTAAYLAETLDVELEGKGEFETGTVKHLLNGGVGYRRKALERFHFLPGPVTEHHYNAFVNEQASIGPATLVLSLRADRHPLIDLSKTISPRGAAIVRVADKTSVRLSAGTAFRVPTLVESYMNLAVPTDNDGVFIRDFGSEDLVPERILTVEAGAHDESTLYHTADMVVYYNRVQSLIGLGPVIPAYEPYDPERKGFAAGYTGWVNLPEIYHGVGIEAEGELFPTDGLDLFGNVNVMRVMQQNPGEAQMVPEESSSLLKLNLGATYRSPLRTDLSLSANYVSSQTWRLRGFDAAGGIEITERSIPGRLMINARVAARPLPDDDLELSLTAWNVLGLSEDLQRREHPNGQLVSARVFGSASYRF